MKITEAYTLYKQLTQKNTAYSHGGKILKFLEVAGDRDVEQVFDDEILKAFIFDGKQKARGKYDALRSFFLFIKVEVQKQPENLFVFPIHLEEVINFDISNFPVEPVEENEGVVYLKRDFDFKELFNEKYYEHMKSREAILTVKAAIALGLSAGYDSGEMFVSRTNPSMELNGFYIDEESIKVRNYKGRPMVEWITIIGDMVKYIKDYYDIRKITTSLPKPLQNFFFTRLWVTQELKIDLTISTGRKDRKPGTDQELVLYALKYISRELGLEIPLKVTDLRSNMVLHSLYNSKGANLQQIIRTYGYPIYVQDAFEKYCKEVTFDNDTVLFSDYHFFDSTPSEHNHFKDEQQENSDGEKAKLIQYLAGRYERDSSIARELKELYEGKCQICGKDLILIDGISYSESCHIHPRSKDGIDDKSNILILCPNHHVLLDMGIISINPEDSKTLFHIDKNNSIHNTQLKIQKHKLLSINIRYHYENIFLPVFNKVKELNRNKLRV